jgi:hypothetical protein
VSEASEVGQMGQQAVVGAGAGACGVRAWQERRVEGARRAAGKVGEWVVRDGEHVRKSAVEWANECMP